MLDAQRFGVDEEPCLSVRHLSKRFGAGCPHCLAPAAQLERNVCPRCGTVHAVRDVSLDVFPAEIVGIVGESGSGKSSLMKCLFFDEEATEGDVRARPFDGGAANLLQLSPQHQRAIRNTVFGMVYQNPYLGLRMDFSSLSNIAEQMIAAGNRNVGAMRVRGEELLARVNIPLSREAEPPRNFSGGMQQRVQMGGASQDLAVAGRGRVGGHGVGKGIVPAAGQRQPAVRHRRIQRVQKLRVGTNRPRRRTQTIWPPVPAPRAHPP